MKTKNVLLAAFAAGTLLTGCKPTENQPTPSDSTTTQLEQVKKETKEAAQAINDYAYAQRMEFAAKMKSDLAQLNQEMDQLAVAIENSNDATKAEAQARLQAMREKTAELNTKLDGIKDASESGWEDFKSGLRKGYDEVKDSFNQARQWLSEKIAPKGNS